MHIYGTSNEGREEGGRGGETHLLTSSDLLWVISYGVYFGTGSCTHLLEDCSDFT